MRVVSFILLMSAHFMFCFVTLHMVRTDDAHCANVLNLTHLCFLFAYFCHHHHFHIADYVFDLIYRTLLPTIRANGAVHQHFQPPNRHIYKYSIYICSSTQTYTHGTAGSHCADTRHQCNNFAFAFNAPKSVWTTIYFVTGGD